MCARDVWAGQGTTPLQSLLVGKPNPSATADALVITPTTYRHMSKACQEIENTHTPKSDQPRAPRPGPRWRAFFACSESTLVGASFIGLCAWLGPA